MIDEIAATMNIGIYLWYMMMIASHENNSAGWFVQRPAPDGNAFTDVTQLFLGGQLGSMPMIWQLQ